MSVSPSTEHATTATNLMEPVQRSQQKTCVLLSHPTLAPGKGAKNWTLRTTDKYSVPEIDSEEK
jgi:hypothetical protein